MLVVLEHRNSRQWPPCQTALAVAGWRPWGEPLIGVGGIRADTMPMKRIRVQNSGRSSTAVSLLDKNSSRAASCTSSALPSMATPWEEGQARRLGAKPFPRYLVCTRTDGDTFTNTKPLFFVEHIEDKFGEVDSVSKMRSGALLIKTTSADQSAALRSCTHLGSVPVSIVPHQSLNMVQGYHFSPRSPPTN